MRLFSKQTLKYAHSDMFKVKAYHEVMRGSAPSRPALRAKQHRMCVIHPILLHYKHHRGLRDKDTERCDTLKCAALVLQGASTAGAVQSGPESSLSPSPTVVGRCRLNRYKYIYKYINNVVPCC